MLGGTALICPLDLSHFAADVSDLVTSEWATPEPEPNQLAVVWELNVLKLNPRVCDLAEATLMPLILAMS